MVPTGDFLLGDLVVLDISNLRRLQGLQELCFVDL